MKRNNFPLLLTAVILAALLVLSSFPGCSAKSTTTTTATAQPIKTYPIGLCAELSGFLGAYNTATVNEAQIAVDIVNEQGGIVVNGQNYLLKLVVEDGQSTID